MMARRRPPPPPTRLRAINGRVPPNALDAEAAVLSACLLKPDVIESVATLTTQDFFNESNGLIWSAILELHSSGRPVDTVMVGELLRDREQLGRVGGNAYLAQICDSTPAVSNVAAHAELVVQAARRRAFISECQRLSAEGYGEVPPDWLSSSVRALADASGDQTSKGVINSAWEPLPDDWLMVPPEPRTWLLQHPTRDGEACPPGQGDGLLPLGRAGLLSSSGGTGKTMILAQLAISVALGLPWLDHFHVAPDAAHKRVLLALAEEKRDEAHRRMWDAAELLRLTEAQRIQVARLVMPLGLAGKPVSLVAPSADGTCIEETNELRDLRRRLESVRYRRCRKCRRSTAADLCPCGEPATPMIGWSLIVIDPLARWAGADTESDNAAATRFVQACESLSDAPGNPSVIVAHHSSKDSRKNDTVDSRGVTGITDGFRWGATLRSNKQGVFFVQSKSNYSPPMHEELHLVRCRGGVMRAKTAEEQAEEQAKREDRMADREHRQLELQEHRIAQATRGILETLHKAAKAATPIKTRSSLLALVKGAQQAKSDALSRLMAEGRVLSSKEGYSVVNLPERSTSGMTPEQTPQGALFEASL